MFFFALSVRRAIFVATNKESGSGQVLARLVKNCFSAHTIPDHCLTRFDNT